MEQYVELVSRSTNVLNILVNMTQKHTTSYGKLRLNSLTDQSLCIHAHVYVQRVQEAAKACQ